MTWLHIFLIEVVDIYKGLLYDKAWIDGKHHQTYLGIHDQINSGLVQDGISSIVCFDL